MKIWEQNMTFIIFIIFLFIIFRLIKKSKKNDSSQAGKTAAAKPTAAVSNKGLPKNGTAQDYRAMDAKTLYEYDQAHGGNFVQPMPGSSEDPAQVSPSMGNQVSFPEIYSKSQTQILNELIDGQMEKLGFDPGKEDTPGTAKRRRISIALLSAVLAGVVVIAFFHLSIAVAIILLIVFIILLIYYMKSINPMAEVRRQIMARPDEDMEYTAAEVLSQRTPRSRFLIAIPFLAAALVMLLFLKPHIIYEPSEYGEGYDVHFYTVGLTSLTDAQIPSSYKGKPVLGLRGSSFRNAFTLKRVSIPDTIVDIRGGAFSGCRSLQGLQLPTKIKEIRAKTFENCSSLRSIEIPSGVTQIHAHAFYGCSDLAMVSIPDSMQSIGSSAFRRCSSLVSITLPMSCVIDSRTFKESPTNVEYR